MEKFTCENCGYYWKDEYRPYPYCHYVGDDKAPCEYDDTDFCNEDEEEF